MIPHVEGLLPKEPVISIVGLGKLGTPIYKVLSQYYKVIGIDKVVGWGTTSFNRLGDITFVIVPTPSLPDYKFTSAYVEDVLKKIDKKQAVSIVSTLMPGDTERLQVKYPHLTLIYNPTFVALGSVEYDFTHPDFILIGGTDDFYINFLKIIYTKICLVPPTFHVMSSTEAEITKLTLNCYITSKITFANQIGNLCHRLKIDPEIVLNAVGSDSRVGHKYFKAGLGYGGPCFPRDNLAMSAFMIDKGLDPALTRTIHQLNKKQIDEIVQRVEEKNPSSVGFSGLSYKEGSEVEDESQLKAIWDILVKRGYKVKIGKGDINLTWGGIND